MACRTLELVKDAAWRPVAQQKVDVRWQRADADERRAAVGRERVGVHLLARRGGVHAIRIGAGRPRCWVAAGQTQGHISSSGAAAGRCEEN